MGKGFFQYDALNCFFGCHFSLDDTNNTAASRNRGKLQIENYGRELAYRNHNYTFGSYIWYVGLFLCRCCGSEWFVGYAACVRVAIFGSVLAAISRCRSHAQGAAVQA